MTELQDIMDEVFGLHPPAWTVVRQITETILQLAELGGVLATICPADKKIIHGMKDAILAPCVA